MRSILTLSFAVLSVAVTVTGQQNSPPGKWAEAMAAGDDASDDFDHDKAVAHFRTALKEAETFGESDVRLLDTLAHLARDCNEADECASKDGKAWLDRALRIRSKSIGSDDSSAGILTSLAEAAIGQERYQDALLLYGEAVDIYEKLQGPKGQSVARTYADIAWVYQYDANPAQARTTFNQALSLLQDAGPASAEDYARLVQESGRLYTYQDKEPEARQEFDRAIQLYSRIWRESDERFIEAMRNIAVATRWWKPPAYAEDLYKRIVDIQRRAHSERSEGYYAAVFALASFHQSGQRWTEAEKLYSDALAVRAALRKRDLETAVCLTKLANARSSLRKYAEAIEAARASLEIRIENDEDPESNVLSGHALLAELYARAEQHDRADASYQTFAEVTRTANSQWLASVSDELGEIYSQQGSYARAAAMLETALAIHELNPALSKAVRAEKIMRLAKVYSALGDNDRATRLESMAAQLQFAAAMEGLKSGDNAKYVLLALSVIAGVFFCIALIAAVAWFFLSRRLDRSLARLYDPPAPQPLPDHVEAVQDSPAMEPFAGDSAEPFAPADAEERVPALELSVDQPEAISTPPGEIATSGRQMEHPEHVTPDAVAPVPVQPAPLPVHGYRFLGDGSTLFEIRVRNLLLSLLTLGVYSFWGKARVRRYLCGQIEFQQDRFVFHGTGRELLFGWLKALPFLAFVIFFPNILPLFWQTPNALVAAQFAVFAAILILWPIASAGAYRYRLNRMSWRGIRFSFRGSTFRYLLLYLGCYLLTALTFGLYAPFFLRPERAVPVGLDLLRRRPVPVRRTWPQSPACLHVRCPAQHHDVRALLALVQRPPLPLLLGAHHAWRIPLPFHRHRRQAPAPLDGQLLSRVRDAGLRHVLGHRAHLAILVQPSQPRRRSRD